GVTKIRTTRHNTRRASSDRRHDRRRLFEGWRREQAEHAAHNVCMVVMTSAAMIDSIPPAPMRAPLKQAKLANKARMIRQPRQAAREYGQAFKIDHALRLRAAEVLETKPAPCASNPFARVIVADNGADTVLPAQRRVFLRRRLRIELARRAAHHVDHVGVAFLVTDRDGVGVRAT